MTPYYADDFVTIYHGDCLNLTPGLHFDGVVTDPPYGLMAVSDSGGFGRRQNHADEHRVIANDDSGETRDRLLELTPAAAAVFHSPRLPEPPGDWDFRLVWDKCRPGMNGGPWRYTHELIFIRGMWQDIGRDCFSIIREPAVPAPQHPNEKPVELMRMILRHFAGSVVLDPFMGSGSTLRAAKDLGLRAVGIEVEERYCELAALRMGQEVLAL